MDQQVEEAADRVSDFFEEKRVQEDPNIDRILDIVRQFIRDNNLVLYGGTAINALLPPDAQFYDYSKEVPDYDFYSPDAKNDAKRLADILYQAGFKDANARSGIHEGTYKVSADFQQVADITQMDPDIFKQIDIVQLPDGMSYSGPLWLRVDIYKQLAEIQGQQSRWPKVWKRLQLLNRYRPLHDNIKQCDDIKKLIVCDTSMLPLEKILPVVINHAIRYRRVFVGSMSQSLYRIFDDIQNTRFSFSEILKHLRCMEGSTSLIDLLSLFPEQDVQILQNELEQSFPEYDVQVERLKDSNELFEKRHQILMNGVPIVEIMMPHQCYGYIELNNLRVATLDTVLTIMFAKLFVDSDQYSLSTKAKYMCMLEYLMVLVEKKGNPKGEGLFARFPSQCYGNQRKLRDIFEERWQNRINRLIAKKRGVYLPNPILNYRPHDEYLIQTGMIDPLDKKAQQRRARRTFRNVNQSLGELNHYYKEGRLPNETYMKLCNGAFEIKRKCVFAKQKWVHGCSSQEICHCVDDISSRLHQFDNSMMSSLHYYNK